MLFGCNRDNDSGLHFVKQYCSRFAVRSVRRICFLRVFHVAGRATATVDGYSEQPFGIETAFRKCHGKSALGAIVCALNEIFPNQIANSVLHLNFMSEIDLRWRTDL